MNTPQTSDARRRRQILLLVSVGAFLATVDAPIVSVATPDIAASFPSDSLSTLAWVLDAYFVAFAAALLAAGRLADRFGRSQFLLAGLFVFVAASVACALATSVEMLIVARVLQAVGGATVLPAGQAILLSAYPAEERYKAITILGTVVALGSVTAPTFGGILVEVASWEWIFWVSAVIGLVALAYGAVVLSFEPGDRESRVPDAVGGLALTLGIALVVFAILGIERWGVADPRVWGTALGGIGATAFSLLRARTHPSPAIDLTLFRNRTLALANGGSFFLGMGLFAFALCSVLFFAQQWGWSALSIGLSFIPGSITSAIAGRVAPRLAGRFTPMRLAAGCGLLAAAGAVLIAVSVRAEENFFVGFVPGQLVYGFGVAAALTALVALAVISAPPEQFAAASGINGALRQVGGAIGVAIVATAFATESLSVLERARIGWLVATAGLIIGGLCAWRMLATPKSAADESPATPAEAAEQSATS